MVLFEGFTISKVFTDTLFADLTLDRLIGIAGLGLPIGYVLYQIYFSFYWFEGFPAFSPADRGGLVLVGANDLGMRLEDAELELLKEKLKDATGGDFVEPANFTFSLFPWARRRLDSGQTEPREEHRLRNLYFMVFAWGRALENVNHPELLEARQSRLIDMYHSVGIVRLALAGAGFLYAVNEFLHMFRDGGYQYFLGVWLAAVVVGLGFLLLSLRRRKILKEWIYFTRDIIYYNYLKK